MLCLRDDSFSDNFQDGALLQVAARRRPRLGEGFQVCAKDAAFCRELTSPTWWMIDGSCSPVSCLASAMLPEPAAPKPEDLAVLTPLGPPTRFIGLALASRARHICRWCNRSTLQSHDPSHHSKTFPANGRNG